MVVEELTTTWLVLLLPLLAVMVVTVRPYVLALLGITLVFIPVGDWQFGGVRVDATDLVLLAVLAASLLRRFGPATIPGSARPYLTLWVAMGVMTSIAYMMAPINQEHLTDPLRSGYQLYRYCWKPILYYPLMLLMVANDRSRLTAVTSAIIIAGDVLAIQATIQGYSGEIARGPFFAGNALGGALVVPIVLALSLLIYSPSRRSSIFAGASLALMARGLLFSSSRGALIATIAAVAVYALMLIRTTGGRQRLVQLSSLGLAALVLAFVVKPDLLNQPNVAHILTAFQGSSDANLQWRMTERWPHFWSMVLDHPWLGTGSAVDLSLSRHANTPHSGYLALALIHGLPAALMILLPGALATLHGVAVFRRGDSTDDRLFALSAVAGLCGLFVHNLVESTLVLPFIAKIYWTLIALVVARRFANSSQTEDTPEEFALRESSPSRRTMMITYGGGR